MDRPVVADRGVVPRDALFVRLRRVVGLRGIIDQLGGGLPEHLEHGREGYLFSPGDASELEGVVRRLAGRPDRVEALRPSGDDVLSLYENARDVEAIYESLT